MGPFKTEILEEGLVIFMRYFMLLLIISIGFYLTFDILSIWIGKFVHEILFKNENIFKHVTPQATLNFLLQESIDMMLWKVFDNHSYEKIPQ